MTRWIRKAWPLAACAILVGFVSSSASAGHAQYRCLDNQLLRVNVEHVARGRWAVTKPHHQPRIPLESRLTCFASPRGDRAAWGCDEIDLRRPPIIETRNGGRGDL